MRRLDRSYLKGWQLIARLVRDEGRSFSGRERHCFFLNTGGPRFAQASSVTGLDYIDDGRASAIVDWDLDGDLDIWLTNRTGPRVRYLQNETDDSGNFVAFQLVGTTCNRDAIGARLEVELPGDPRKHIKTLHAGDGFLAQSSKWVHFGLGDAKLVQRLTVRWPDGKNEQLTNLAANQRYRLTQGTAAATAWSHPRDRVRFVSSTLTEPPATDKTRIVLSPRKAMPDLPMETVEGERISLEDFAASGPVLLNLWHYTCVPCLQELSELSRDKDAILRSGLNIVALHLSDPNADIHTEQQFVQKALAGINYNFASDIAVDECVDRLNNRLQRVLQKHRTIVLPTSLLLDVHSQVVAVYKGPVSADQLLADVALLEASDEELLAAGVPFPGKWHHSPLDEDY